MIALVTAVFIASLVGSVHCAGMCGGIVTLCVSGQPVARRRDWMPHATYNFGRLLSYAGLGAISGALGAAIDLGGSAVGWSRVAMVIAGSAMILVGVAALLGTMGLRPRCIKLPAPLHRVFQRGLAFANTLPPGLRPLTIGFLTGFLPCGWLYAFVISAAGTGSPWLGALTMAVFWAGTLPIMLVLGVGVQKITGRLRSHVPRLTAAALILVGVVTIVGRLQTPAYSAAMTTEVASAADAVDHVRALDAAELPCCDDGS